MMMMMILVSRIKKGGGPRVKNVTLSAATSPRQHLYNLNIDGTPIFYF
jgi:hypothetical protein